MDQNNEVSGIKFETDSWKAVKYYNETSTPKVIQWVMKFSGGSIKEERQAEYVLLGFVIIAIAISLFLFFGGHKNTLQPKEIIDNSLNQTIENLGNKN